MWGRDLVAVQNIFSLRYSLTIEVSIVRGVIRSKRPIFFFLLNRFWGESHCKDLKISFILRMNQSSTHKEVLHFRETVIS